MMSSSDRPWWQTAVIYQIYPRSFRDSNGDGIGDLRGIQDNLPYLADTLGVDAIWISPFYRSPMKDFGYDVADFVDVDPIFGTLADAEGLIEEIHGHGMRVILDYVSNHSSDQHEWFRDSRSSRDSARRDWYIWRDPAPDGGPPNTWLSTFGGPAWTLDEATGQYYLHSFLKSQPDLNWRNPELRDAMYGVLKFWLDRGVDGFRIDAAHYVGKDEQFRDNPPAPPGAMTMHKPMGDYDRQLHLYDKGRPFAHEVYQGIRRFVDEYAEDAGCDDRLLIGEMHLYDWDEWASYYGPELNEFHLPYNFGLLITDWTASDSAELINAIERALPEGAWPNWVVGNHDESRLATRLGAEVSRAAMTLLLTLRGTPTIYYGDELGMPDVEVPLEMMQDPWGLQMPELDVSRDPARSPMLWTTGPHGGFADPDTSPWLPVCDPELHCVAVQIDNPDSMLTLTRKLLQVRKDRQSLRAGAVTVLDGLPGEVLGYVRDHGSESTLVLVSFSNEECSVELDTAYRGLQLLSSIDPERIGELGATIRLMPHEAIVVDIQI
ncbi:alpha-amylase family glycosyl hydrolase [soil metagenome]